MRHPWRLAAATCLLLVAAAVFGYAWYVSDRIASGALDPPLAPRARQLEVVSLSADGVVLRSLGDSNWRRPGTWGLEWAVPSGRGLGGYAQVGAVLEVDEAAGEVTRVVLPGWPTPEAGMRARLDNQAFPVDPASRQIPFWNVTYPAPEGDTPAWLVPGSAGTWLIAVHGRSGDRSDALRLLPSAVEAGMPALVISYRNDPEAPGGVSRQYRYGLDEWRDLEAAVCYARAQGAEGVVLVGYSMGGAIVLSFMRESALAEHVRGLILDAPMLDLRATVRFNLESAGLPGFFVPLPMWIAALRNDLDWGRLDYARQAAALEVPVLLFHGSEDPTVPIETSDRLAAARPDLVEYQRVEGAHHTGSWNLDGARYEAAVLRFLRGLLASVS